jgi:ABC-type multidrug transport system fused ATPase/permease subunit
MALLKRLLQIFSPSERWQLLGMLLLLLIGAGLETFSVGVIPAFVALLSKPDLIENQPWLQRFYHLSGANSIYGFMLLLSVLLLGVFLGKNLYLACLANYQYQFLRRKHVDFASRLFNLYLQAPYTFHLQRNSAEISLTLTSEVHKLFWNVLVPLMTLVSELTITTFLVILLVIVEPVSSLIAVGFLAIALFVFSTLARKVTRRLGQIRQFHDGKVYQWVNQGVGGIKETKILGKEQFFVNTFSDHKSQSENATVTLELIRQYSQLYIETIVIAAVLLIVIVTLLQGRALQAVLPTLSLFAIAALRIMPSAKRIASTTASIRFYHGVVNLISQDLVSLEKIVKTDQRLFPVNDKTLNTFKDSIVLEKVSFSYPGADSPSINNISLSISRGSSVAFVGPSGAGKSTLVDIILGLLAPNEGQIRVDGQTIFDDLAGWQRQIGYIPQSIYLSDDTIRRNVAFGLTEEYIDNKKVWDALRAAQLESLVQKLDSGLNTIIGESGFRLSGGQRQRIGIARAIYHMPKVLVMDEATAALDNETEREFMKALEGLSKDTTLIMIAHRLSTVKNCDTIFFMKNGEIIKSGSYKYLLKTCLPFRRAAL